MVVFIGTYRPALWNLWKGAKPSTFPPANRALVVELASNIVTCINSQNKIFFTIAPMRPDVLVNVLQINPVSLLEILFARPKYLHYTCLFLSSAFQKRN